MRALLKDERLGEGVRILQIDTNACISLPFAPKFLKPRVMDEWWVQNEGRSMWEEGREMVPCGRRGIDDAGRGCRFATASCAGGNAWGSCGCLGEEDWI